MGRPKATKRKDIIPEIDVEKTSKGKKINFDDEEELDVKTDEKRNLIEEENEEIGVKTRRSSRKLKVAEESVEIPQKKSKKINKTEDIEQVEPERIENIPNETENDDEAPELVTAQDNDILKLKKLHEEISLRPKTKKRKREILPKIDTPEELDSSILEAVEEYQEERERQQQIQETEEESSPRENEKPQNLLNRKIGSITVSVLTGRSSAIATSAYTVSKEALNFIQQHQKSVPRISYSSYSAKKIGGPSKTFRVKV